MVGPICTDYAISPADADELKGAALLPADIRRQLTRRLLSLRGPEALADLFAEFIGLANSVVENQREMLEIVAMVDHGMSDRAAEQINFSTIFGALCGVGLAAGIDSSSTCEGCAYRLGTCANQSPATTVDADWCGHPGEVPFMCHMDLDEKGEPTKGCAGFAQLRARRKVAA